ncbi:MAG: ParB/RepB/Spo0J family partition protein [Anaerolineae bacterium]|nr:ParB/RepB/Spo0J family partition protein [Anaerolineae bacterium]
MSELIPLWNLKPSRFQPRAPQFDAEKLLELAQSIHENGLINPVMVFTYNDEDSYMVWELIAGERRSRACAALTLAELFPQHTLSDWCARLAHVGLTGLGDEERDALCKANATIPATVHPGNDMQTIHQIAVIENLDRDDLSPIEEGRAFQGMIDAYGWSQRELAARVNKSQGYIAQRLALLELPEETLEAVNTRVLSLTHARAIASVPEALQPAVTAWAVQAVQSNDAPATSRQVENRVRQIAAFVDPARWERNGETVYRPEQRNRLAVIRQIVQNLVLTEERAEAILSLADEGWERKNLLNMSPIKLVGSAVYTAAVLKALTGEIGKFEDRLLCLCACSSCVLQSLPAQISESKFSYPPCYNIGRKQPLPVCENHIGIDDPVIIPIDDWNLRQALRQQEDMLGPFIEEPFLHLTSVEEYVALHQIATELKQQRDATHEEKLARQHVEKIREYYEWQQSLPEQWRAHFQAHACEKCSHYAPLLAEQGDPPCNLVVDPLWVKRYGGEEATAPEFGCLVAQAGHLAPRCEAFGYRYGPDIYLAGHQERILPARSRVLDWIEAIAAQAKNEHWDRTLWIPFSWLAYVNEPGKKALSWSKLRKWLEKNWDMLGDAAIAHLIDVLISEIELMSKTDGHAVNVLNATDSERTTWRRLRFPFDRYRENDWYIPKTWPEDWPKPWVIDQPVEILNEEADE